MQSGELARRTGVSVDTLHFYEKSGVLPSPRRLDNGYREYSEEAERRVTLIRRALRVGFSLAELAPLLALRDDGQTPCADVHRLAKKKLAQVETQLKELTSLRDELVNLVGHWSERLAETPEGERAYLFESDPILTASKTAPVKGEE